MTDVVEREPFLRAYFHTFKATSAPESTAILEAVASAAKCFHHTDGWDDSEFAGHPEGFWGLIQKRADEAADEIIRLRMRVEELTMCTNDGLAEVERLRAKVTEMVNHVAEASRKQGEAEGRLAASEIAGVVDSWIEKANGLEADNTALRARVEELEGHCRTLLMFAERNEAGAEISAARQALGKE